MVAYRQIVHDAIRDNSNPRTKKGVSVSTIRSAVEAAGLEPKSPFVLKTLRTDVESGLLICKGTSVYKFAPGIFPKD